MTGFLRRIYGLSLPRPKVIPVDPLRKWREELVEKMNPDSGILDKLLEEAILEEQEVEKIRGKETVRERNTKILEYVTKRKQFKEFLNAVEKTDKELFDLLISQPEDTENVTDHRMSRTVSKDRKTKTIKAQRLRKSQKKKKHKPNTSKSVNDLPVGVLDRILMKTILIASSNTNKPPHTRQEKAREFGLQLQTVRSTWHDRVDTSWFKTTLKRLLKRPVCRLQKRIAISGDWIYGVAKLRGTICLLCQWSKSIRLFNDTFPFQLQSEIPLDVIKKPCDLAASDKNESLYVSDSICKCIWKVNVDEKMIHGSDARRVTVWLENIGSPFTLTATRDGHVITVTWGNPSSLDFFGPDARNNRHLSLPTDVEFPLHAVETSVGNLIVSHMWSNSWTWTVSEVTRDGKVIRRFNPPDKRLLLNWPRHLALDPDDRVFVSDCENDRVVLIDSTLDSCCVLLTRGVAKIARPDRVCYDSDNRQLVVGHFEGQVDIYNFG